MTEITHSCGEECSDGCWYEGSDTQQRDQDRLDALEAERGYSADDDDDDGN